MKNNEEQIRDAWDEYWTNQGTSSNDIYNFIAAFYRNRIIKPYLNRYLSKYFRRGEHVLHAGCGSGMVDRDVVRHLEITALDISPEALLIYRKVNPEVRNTCLGNIFHLPFQEATFDGVYNLGVMEHFTEDEIVQILKEFARVLRPGGRIVLFIPPVFGATVQVLDFTHFVLNKILQKQISLHPKEITRVKSQRHIRGLIEAAGFRFKEYYFGYRDAFTQIMIAGEK